MAEYPKTGCKKHGDDVECYVVCSHVVSGTAPAFYSEAPDEHPGLIVCESCSKIPRPLKSIDDFAPVCAICAVEQGWLSRRGPVQ